MADLKTFLITGASSGLGKAMMDQILEQTSYFGISVSRSKRKEHERFSRFTHFDLDLSKTPTDFSYRKLKDCIRTEQIIIVNNAGVINPIEKIGQFESEDVFRHVSINYLTPLLFYNNLLPLLEKKKLTILNISTGAASHPISGWSLYSSSKAAISMFFETLKHENPCWDVRNIDPGVMDTKMQETIRDSEFQEVQTFRDFKKLGKLNKASTVAKEILEPYL